MRVLHLKPSVFAVITFMTVLATIFELGAMQGNLKFAENITEWVQGLTWQSQTNACTTNCGAATTAKDSETNSIAFKPEGIKIPSIGLNKTIVSAPLKNGTWAVAPAVGNYAEGTSLVTQKGGNVGLFGHALPNAFLPIKNAKIGATIELYGSGYKATYKITKTDIVTPNRVDVFYPTQKASVTLITCDGPQDIHRYMLRGELVKIEKVK